MSQFYPALAGGRSSIMLAALVILGATTAGAQNVAPSDASAAIPGRIDFQTADLPPATVEVDLSQGMFRDVFGLGEAALAGVAETLLQSADAGDAGPGTQLAADQLTAAREIVQLASNLVREVRVRVYDDLPDDWSGREGPFSLYDEQLRSAGWETVVRVRDGDEGVRVSVLRDSEAIRGVFIAAADGNEFVLVNLACDLSPENVKELASKAAEIGMENGLGQVLEAHMRELERRLPPAARRHPRHDHPGNDQ